MNRDRPPDSGTFKVFVVLGLLTLFAVLAIRWALNAPLTESLRPPVTIPASK